MNSRDFIHPSQKRDLLQQRRAQQIASSIVQVGSSQMRLYHADMDLYPKTRPPLIDPRERIIRGRETWSVLAKRDPDSGFIPRHIITDREIDSFRVMVKK